MKTSYICYVFCITRVSCVINNVCPTIEDYYTIAENPRCWYDFTAASNVTEIITRYGYPVEIHKCVTPDGYILTVIRIPPQADFPSKGPVFMQHGLWASASTFVSSGKNSLAFLLANAGYDVWLGNFRGNEYSEEHVNMTANNRKYWDYSVDEMGLYDIPSQLTLITEKTGKEGDIVYIGHSLGGTTALIYGSSYPEEAKKTVKLFILMAPAYTLSNMESPLKLVTPWANQIYSIIVKNDLIKLLSKSSILGSIMRTICLESPRLMKRCTEMFNLVFGINSQMGAETIPVACSQFPAGASIKIFTQTSAMTLGFFGRYGYGLDNHSKYGSWSPPRYEVSRIPLPVFIIHSEGDWLCTKKDILILYNHLPQHAKKYGIHEISEKNFNHIDYLYAKSAKHLVYDHILSLMAKL